MRKPLRYFAVLVGIAILLLAMAAAGLLVWVAMEERPVPRAIPYIADALVPEGATYSVEIAEASTTWKSWSSPLMLRVKDVRFIDNGNTILRLKDAEVSFSILRLLTGQIEPTGLFVNEAAIRLTRLADGAMVLGFGENPAASTSLESVLTGNYGTGGADSGSTLKTIQMENASIELADVRGDYFVLREADLRIERKDEGFGGAITGKGFYKGGEPIELALEIQHAPEDDTNVLELAANGLPIELLPRMLPDLSILEGVDFDANGTMQFVLDNEWNLLSSSADITTGKGTYTNTELYDRPLVIDSVVLRIATEEGLNKITMEEGVFDLGRSLMKMKGNLELTGEKKIYLEAYLRNYGVSRLQNFWPKTAAPETRGWVLEHARWGRVAEATLRIDSTLDELQLPVVPDDAVQAKLQVDRFRIFFLDNFPPITSMEGYFLIGGDSARAEFVTGKYGRGTQVHHADFLIPSFAPPVEMQIGIDFTAPAYDVADFMSRPPISLTDKIGIDPDTVGGTVKASLNYKAGFDKNPATKDEIDGEVTLIDLSVPGVMGLADLNDFDGVMKIDTNQLAVDGRGQLNGVAFTLDSESKLPSAHGRYHVTATADTAMLAQYGIVTEPYLSGPVPLDVTVDYGAERIGVEARADLTGVRISIDELDVEKLPGRHAVLTAIGDFRPDAGLIDLDHVQLTGDELSFEGSGEFTLASPYVRQISVERLQFGEQDVSGSYRKEGGMHVATLKARSVDLRPWLKPGADIDPRDPASYSEELLKIPDMDVTVDIGTLQLVDEGALTDVHLDAYCLRERCRRANVTGNAGGAPFEFHIEPSGKGRILRAHARDAGGFLKHTGIYPNIEGGEMFLSGCYVDTPEYTKLLGELVITQHRIRNAPLLAKLLNVASLVGIVDGLSGRGIAFTRLSAPFEWNNFVLELTKAKTQGPSMALTANGFVDLNRMHLDMEGAVVPANFLNSLAAKIPLIGRIFTGEEGAGIFVASYDIEGPISDPRIRVNPLSLLTPGFLRDIFDKVDEPDVPPALQEERAAEAADAARGNRPAPQATLPEPGMADRPRGLPEGYRPSVPAGGAP